MYDLGFLPPRTITKCCSAGNEVNLCLKDTPHRKDGRSILSSAFDIGHGIHIDLLSGNFPVECITAAHDNTEDIVQDGKNPAVSKSGSTVESKLGIHDYRVIDSRTSGVGKRASPQVVSNSLNKPIQHATFDNPISGFDQHGHDKETDFEYGLDALIHGGQLGFGPQPSFLVAPRALPLAAWARTQDFYDELEGCGNATILTETQCCVLPESSRRKGESLSNDALVWMQSSQFFGERRNESGDTSLQRYSACRSEMLIKDGGQDYLQEADFLLTQLLGENDDSGIYTDKGKLAQKSTVADLEALLSYAPATRGTPPPSSSNRLMKSASTNHGGDVAASTGKVTIATGGGCSRRQEEVSFPSNGKGRCLELEYPVYDDSLLHQTLVWPDTPAISRTRKSARKTEKRSGSSEVDDILETTPREEGSTLDQIMQSMEYPSIESLHDSSRFLMEDLCPLFPQVSCVITGMKDLTAPLDETESQLHPSLEKVVAKTPCELDQDVRNQEQRIVKARRQASGMSWSSTSRMVVIHNRYAPKFRKPPDSPSSSEIRKLKRQQEENEARRARVQAFLDKRPAVKAAQGRAETENTAGKEPAKKTTVDSIVASKQLSSPSSISLKSHHQRHKTGATGRALRMLPCLKEPPNGVTDRTEESASPLSRAARSENHVRSLVVNYTRGDNAGNRRVTMKLHGKNTLEIRQSREESRFFEVDEYLECAENNNLYSMTLFELRQKFLSGMNVALFLAGSESAPLVSWRAVREVMKGVFRDMGGDCELFMSVALVRQGLTQDLLSGSGRLMRTTFNLSPLLNTSLDNVGYTKLRDLGHLSRLIVHSWEFARFHQVHELGFIVISIILKQVKEDDMILSSMLVTCGASSVHHLNGVLKKGEREPYQLFSGPLGGSCFTVSVLTVCEDDDGVVQLMNTQRKLSSIVNEPGILGSVRDFIERAEKELTHCENGDRQNLGKCDVLREQIACVKRAMLDPKNYTPRETVEELQKRHKMGSAKAGMTLSGGSLLQVSNPDPSLGATKPGSTPQKQQRVQNQTHREGVVVVVGQQHSISGDASRTINKGRGHVGEKLPHSSLLQVARGGKTELAASPLKVAVMPIIVPRRYSTKSATLPQREEGKVGTLPSLQGFSTTVRQDNKTNTLPPVDAAFLNNINLVPVVRRKGRRCLVNSSPNPEKEQKTLTSQALTTTPTIEAQGHKALDNVEGGSHTSRGRTTCVGLNPPPQMETSTNAKTGSVRTKQLRELMTCSSADAPLVSNSDILCHLSDSAPVGATASTRYIGRAEAPLQKPVFRVLEMESRLEVDALKKKSINGLLKTPNDNNCSLVRVPPELPPYGCGNKANRTVTVGQDSPSSQTPEHQQKKKNENKAAAAAATVVAGEEEEEDWSAGKVRDVEKEEKGDLMATQHASLAAAPSKVRKLVVVDPRCSKTANVTHDGNMVVVMTEDDFEEYEVDEVVERPDGCESMHSSTLNELRDTFLMGCNAAILAADSRSSAVSSLVLKSIVRDVLADMDMRGARTPPHHKGMLSVSIVQLKGEMVLDLLKEKSTPQKLVIAISPIFGPCVHDVSRLPVDGVVVFDSMLTTALTRAAENERDYGVVFVSLVLKQRLGVEGAGDVLVSSLVASLVGENVGVYAAVLDRSPLIPRALFHYALGGPCYTVALLSFSGDETRANQMLAVQKRLGEVFNRPTHRGSINKFISGIRNDLAPSLREKLVDSDRCEATGKILQRLDEMVRDAEMVLENFDKSEPRAYLNDAEMKRTVDRKPPPVTLTSTSERERVRTLVCFEQRLLGSGSVAVQGNSVLARVGEFACRYDVDELVVREPGSNVLHSQLIDDLVMKFLSGHSTALLSADSRNSAVTPLLLRKIAYLVVYNMTMDPHPTNIWGELLVSMALIRDDVTVDLLAVDSDLAFHRFEVELSPLFSRRLLGVSCHSVTSAERFDQLLAVAVERAEPALRSEDPGVMVVSLSLTQHVEKPSRDVLLSSFMATTVFDKMSHYTGILQNSPNEPTELLKFALGGPCHTIAMLGLSDEDEDAGQLLAVQMELAHVRNRPSHPMSLAQHICELKKGIVTLEGHLELAENEQQVEAIRAKIARAESFLQEAEALLSLPKGEQSFVPLGSHV